MLLLNISDELISRLIYLLICYIFYDYIILCVALIKSYILEKLNNPIKTIKDLKIHKDDEFVI